MKISEVKERILSYNTELIEWRRHFHMYPELSMEEVETTKTLAKELDKLGISYRLVEPTGIIAEIKGGKPGKTVALRADMDALPVEELNDTLAYASKKQGLMHACGHDTHMSMLLTAVKVLNDVKEELNGNVRILFQPGEEAALGAKLLIKEGALEGVDAIFGEHIWAPLDAGIVTCEEGPRMGACDVFYVSFHGKAGHGAMPESAIDATVMGASYVQNVQSIISRNIDPLHSAVVTVGKFVSGTRFNVISGECELEGSIRTFTEEERVMVETKLREFAEATAKMYGGTMDFKFVRGTDVVNNNAAESARVRNLVSRSFGDDKLRVEPPMCVAEDFGAYTDRIPGAFALVGARNEAKGCIWQHHNGNFNVDEDALKVGAELYALYALDFLGNLDD